MFTGANMQYVFQDGVFSGDTTRYFSLFKVPKRKPEVFLHCKPPNQVKLEDVRQPSLDSKSESVTWMLVIQMLVYNVVELVSVKYSIMFGHQSQNPSGSMI